MSLQLLAEAFKHEHPFCELTSIQTYGVSYFRNKFYFYFIDTGFRHNNALICKVIERNSYYDNYMLHSCQCNTEKCISCRVKELEASEVAIRFNRTNKYQKDYGQLGDSYIECGESELILYTLKYCKYGLSTISNTIKLRTFLPIALPFMVKQLEPQLMLIREMNIIDDIRLLIARLFVMTYT